MIPIRVDPSSEPTPLRIPWLERWIKPPDISAMILVALVAATGVLAAFSVHLFEGAVDFLFGLGYRRFPAVLGQIGLPRWVAFVLYPVVLGLLVALVKALVPTADRQHAIPLVIVALQKRGGLIRLGSTLLKSLGSILTLGAGGSLGREGPVVLLGGGLGSAVGQAAGTKDDGRRMLVAAGAAAAIATAFHAPITGAFFAMEIVLIQFSARSFALTALASVTAAEFSHLVEATPPFPIPAYHMNSPWEIILFFLLGLVIAPLARVYIKVLYRSQRIGGKIHWIPTWLKPALSGILFGAVALVIPETLGSGHRTIVEALAGNLPLTLLLMLLVGKLITIGITSGGGWPGGVFTPAMFLGSMAGGAFGMMVRPLLPVLDVQPGAYAVVGMAAMVAGATHAPLTAMSLIFEVTRDYRIALPAMLASAVATVFSQRMSLYSIDTIALGDQGILLPWQLQDLRAVLVSEVMAKKVHTVQSTDQIKAVIHLMQQYQHQGYPVLDQHRKLAGIITLQDVREIPLEGRLETPVSEAMSTDLVTIHPHQTLAEAAVLMARHDVGSLPVVDSRTPGRLVGIISRSDILRSYPSESILEVEEEENSSERP